MAFDRSHERTLLESLERQSGRSFNSRADVVAYLSAHDGVEERKTGSTVWTALRHGALALALAIAFLQYYLMDVYVQIMALPSVTFLSASG